MTTAELYSWSHWHIDAVICKLLDIYSQKENEIKLTRKNRWAKKASDQV